MAAVTVPTSIAKLPLSMKLDHVNRVLYETPGVLEPSYATITAAAHESTVSDVSIQWYDANGVAMAVPVIFFCWIATSSAGTTLTGASPTTIAHASTGGTVLWIMTAGKAFLWQTTAAGLAIMSKTDASKTADYVCVAPLRGRCPMTYKLMATADYGA
jgi:hypothetical protein